MKLEIRDLKNLFEKEIHSFTDIQFASMVLFKNLILHISSMRKHSRNSRKIIWSPGVASRRDTLGIIGFNVEFVDESIA